MSAETWLLSMMFTAFVVVPVGYWFISVILEGNRNGANCEPAGQDNVIRATLASNPDPSVPAIELVEQRGGSGRNRGPVKHVYLADYSNDRSRFSGNHAHQTRLDWMRAVVPGHTQSRAEEAGVIIHIVSEAEQDRRSAPGGGSPVWHNTAPTIEGGSAITTTTTKPGSGNCVLVVLAAACVVVMIGLAVLIVAGRMGALS